MKGSNKVVAVSRQAQGIVADSRGEFASLSDALRTKRTPADSKWESIFDRTISEVCVDACGFHFMHLCNVLL
jgi:hypothetical protein